MRYVVINDRFLIVPTVRMENVASHSIGNKKKIPTVNMTNIGSKARVEAL